MDFVQRLTQALHLDLPYSDRQPFMGARQAAVLALVSAGWMDSEEEPALLLTRRAEIVLSHKGQMAFPGGHVGAGESSIDAALRETEEEVGLARGRVEVIGELPPLWTATGFRISPVVGRLRSSRIETELKLQSAELAEAMWVPFAQLRDPTRYRHETIEVPNVRGVRYLTHVYWVGPHRVWGATASMIKNLLDRLERVG